MDGWEKGPKKAKNCLRKAWEVLYQIEKVFISGKKDLKPMQKTGRKTKTPNRQGYPQWSRQFCCRGKFPMARV